MFAGRGDQSTQLFALVKGSPLSDSDDIAWLDNGPSRCTSHIVDEDAARNMRLPLVFRCQGARRYT